MVFAAALKVFALSEIILIGNPLLDAKLINDCASGTRSICTALVKHVYRHIQTFREVGTDASLTCNGPAKSTLVFENGCDSFT